MELDARFTELEERLVTAGRVQPAAAPAPAPAAAVVKK